MRSNTAIDSADQSGHTGIWAMVAALIALKALFAASILVIAAGEGSDRVSLLGQTAMHWTPVTIALLAVPISLIWKTQRRPSGGPAVADRTFAAPAGFIPLQSVHAFEG